MADLVFNGVRLTGVTFQTFTATLTTIGVYTSLFTVPPSNRAIVLRAQKRIASNNVASIYMNTGGQDYLLVTVNGIITDSRYVFEPGESVTAMKAYGSTSDDIIVTVAVFPDTNLIYSRTVLATLPAGTFTLHTTTASNELALFAATTKKDVLNSSLAAGTYVKLNGGYAVNLGAAGIPRQITQVLQLGLVSGDVLDVVSNAAYADQWVFVTLYTP